MRLDPRDSESRWASHGEDVCLLHSPVMVTSLNLKENVHSVWSR